VTGIGYVRVYMLRIRLRRVGKKGHPSYRIVVADSAAPRDGKYLEWIGNYDPMKDPPAISLKEDRAARWLGEGAQPSDAVKRILDKSGILDRAPSFGTAAGSSTTEAVPTSATMVRTEAVSQSDTVQATVEDETSTTEADVETAEE
jgi:small subunit ribosomal protein S16